MPPQHSLFIGLHLSEKDSTGSRRDPHNAIQYLFRAADDTEDLRLKEIALNRLYFLQEKFIQKQQFEKLLNMIHTLRIGYNLHLESASTHLNYSYKLAPDRQKQQGLALSEYLEFLSTPQSEHRKLIATKRGVIKTVKELMNVDLRKNSFLAQRKEKINNAIAAHDRTNLKDYAESLKKYITDMARMN